MQSQTKIFSHLVKDYMRGSPVVVERGTIVRDLLGRDAGLRVAAIDYMTNVKSMLRNPTIVELAQLRRTERSAITDDLTGLYNRRYLQTALDVMAYSQSLPLE